MTDRLVELAHPEAAASIHRKASDNVAKGAAKDPTTGAGAAPMR